MANIPGDISSRVGDVRNTFSSWDSCMAKSYCKYPVIAGIVIGALILLSVVWCVASCLCCGATLCGSCLRCITCFGCCGACKGRGGGGGRTRHKDDYSQMPPTPYNGYQAQPSPMTYQPAHAGPQYAQFDTTTKNVHADSLPAMPSWENARTVRVADHSQPANSFGNDVEMGRIDTAQYQPRTRGDYNQVPDGSTSPMLPPVNHGQFQGQHPYSSDLGAQRISPYQQQTGYTDFDPSPLSPAPTYRTAPSIAVSTDTDRFARGALSPTPSEYNRHNFSAPAREQAWSPLPSVQHDTTDYQSYRRSLSPPVDHNAIYYDHYQQEQSGVRPPSLLQVGRKPVNGSQREI